MLFTPKCIDLIATDLGEIKTCMIYFFRCIFVIYAFKEKDIPIMLFI